MRKGQFDRALYDHFKNGVTNIARAYCVSAPKGIEEECKTLKLTPVNTGAIKDGYCYLLIGDSEEPVMRLVEMQNQPGGYAHILVH